MFGLLRAAALLHNSATHSTVSLLIMAAIFFISLLIFVAEHRLTDKTLELEMCFGRHWPFLLSGSFGIARFLPKQLVEEPNSLRRTHAKDSTRDTLRGYCVSCIRLTDIHDCITL